MKNIYDWELPCGRLVEERLSSPDVDITQPTGIHTWLSPPHCGETHECRDVTPCEAEIRKSLISLQYYLLN